MEPETMRLVAVAFWSGVGGVVLTLVAERACHVQEVRRLKARMAEQIDTIYRSGWLAGVEWEQEVGGKAEAHRVGFGAGYAVQFRLAEQEIAARCKACASAKRVE